MGEGSSSPFARIPRALSVTPSLRERRGNRQRGRSTVRIACPGGRESLVGEIVLDMIERLMDMIDSRGLSSPPPRSGGEGRRRSGSSIRVLYPPAAPESSSGLGVGRDRPRRPPSPPRCKCTHMGDMAGSTTWSPNGGTPLRDAQEGCASLYAPNAVSADFPVAPTVSVGEDSCTRNEGCDHSHMVAFADWSRNAGTSLGYPR